MNEQADVEWFSGVQAGCVWGLKDRFRDDGHEIVSAAQKPA